MNSNLPFYILIAIFFICLLGYFFFEVLGYKYSIFDKGDLYSAYQSKNDKQPFILLRDQKSYYLPEEYQIRRKWINPDEKLIGGLSYPFVKAEKVHIVKSQGITLKNAYFKKIFGKYTFYVPYNTKVYDKEIALKLLKDDKLSNNCYMKQDKYEELRDKLINLKGIE